MVGVPEQRSVRELRYFCWRQGSYHRLLAVVGHDLGGSSWFVDPHVILGGVIYYQDNDASGYSIGGVDV